MQQSPWNSIAASSNSTLFDFTHNMRAQIISLVSLNHEPRKTCWRLQIFSTKSKLVSFYGIQETFGNIWTREGLCSVSGVVYQSWIKHITIKCVKHVCSKEGLRSESYLSYHLLETVCNAWMESWVRKIARDERMIPRAVWWELIYVCLTQRENETQHQPPALRSPGSCVPCFVLWEPHMRHNSEPAALFTAGTQSAASRR